MHDRLSWAQAAFARILQPAVRLALAMGLKHQQLEEVLRDLLVDEARKLWRKKDGSKPNLSQLATTTGLNRKDVTTRVRDGRTVLPATESSAAAKAYTAWLQVVAEDESQRKLPLADSGSGQSFELLSRFATRGNVHHRTVLEELQRLNLVTLSDGEVHLLGDSFVPPPACVTCSHSWATTCETICWQQSPTPWTNSLACWSALSLRRA